MINPSIFDKIRKPDLLLRITSYLLLFAFINLEISCNYYRVRSLDRLSEEVTKTKLLDYQSKYKYIILNSKGNRYHLSSIEINKDQMTLTAEMSLLDNNHSLYYPNSRGNARYRNSRGQGQVINEVHLLAENFTKLADNKVSIDLKDIKRLDIIERDTGRTIASYVFSIICISTAISILLFIIILLTKSSCPFIYVKDGQSFVFKGELFGGAIFKPLERDDFISLKSQSENDSVLQIKISNELQERQFTNLAEVVLAEHDKGIQTLIDSKGNIHTILEPVMAQKALLNNSIDETVNVSKTDSVNCLFDSRSNPLLNNELTLTFNKPLSAKNGKLILHAKNSLWLDFAFGEFTKLFGAYYNSWIIKQRNANSDSLQAWVTKQNLPLSVYLKANNNWELVEQIPTIGPLASRDLCIPINFDASSNSTIEVKLKCGFMFWEVDYAAMDFSKDMPLLKVTLAPSSAIDESGNKCLSELLYTDKDYLYQPGPGYEATINYTIPVCKAGKQYDAYLHTRGYYEHKRDYNGIPDRKLLESFKQEGAFVEFSGKLFNQIEQNAGFASSH